MEVNYMLLLALCWTLIVVGCASTSLEVKVNPNTGLDPKSSSTVNNNSNLDEKTGGLESVMEFNKVEKVKEGKDQVGGSKEGIQNNKFNEGESSEQKQVGLKEGNTEKKDKDGSIGEGDKKEKLGEGLESKDVAKEVPILLPPVRKDGFHGEECDTSNSCKDEKNALVACLRFPGNDSPDLSLLIQNKGNGALSVTISAPDFVWLEKSKIQLHEKEDKKVKVSISNGGTDSLIVLRVGKDNCSLLIPQDFRKETDYSTKAPYINLFKRPIFVALIVFAALVITASAWMCVSRQRRHLTSNVSKYQKLDMELPVSGGAKVESDSNDGWDNSWGDNWDDEEAPKTPSMPVTPSLSSKGLASRRFNKEGWKD